MKILAIDAATEACSVALCYGNDVIDRFTVAPQQHSKLLLPMVDEVLNEAGMTLTQLDGIAFGQGPGSFTGVRIGVAITQGLAFGADLPTLGISNLAMMAQQAIVQYQAEKVVAAIDARMSEVYLGYYQNDNGVAKLLAAEQVIKPENIEPIAGFAQGAAQVGTGWSAYQATLAGKFDLQHTDIALPQAKYMLPLAKQGFEQGLGKPADEAQPNYVRDEVTWQKLPGR